MFQIIQVILIPIGFLLKSDMEVGLLPISVFQVED